MHDWQKLSPHFPSSNLVNRASSTTPRGVVTIRNISSQTYTTQVSKQSDGFPLFSNNRCSPEICNLLFRSNGRFLGGPHIFLHIESLISPLCCRFGIALHILTPQYASSIAFSSVALSLYAFSSGLGGQSVHSEPKFKDDLRFPIAEHIRLVNR